MIHIANPIYDVVFKYLLDDHKVARKLLSLIIGETIETLDFKPTERRTAKSSAACRWRPPNPKSGKR